MLPLLSRQPHNKAGVIRRQRVMKLFSLLYYKLRSAYMCECRGLQCEIENRNRKGRKIFFHEKKTPTTRGQSERKMEDGGETIRTTPHSQYHQTAWSTSVDPHSFVVSDVAERWSVGNKMLC